MFIVETAVRRGDVCVCGVHRHGLIFLKMLNLFTKLLVGKFCSSTRALKTSKKEILKMHGDIGSGYSTAYFIFSLKQLAAAKQFGLK